MSHPRVTPFVVLLIALAPVGKTAAQSIALEDFGSFGGYHNTVLPSASYVFIGQSDRMLVASWSGTNLVPVSSVTLDDEPLSLFVSGNRGYAVYANQFDVVDLTDPLNPSLVGSNAFGVSTSRVRRVFVSGGYAYVAQDTPAGGSSFWILNAPGTGGGLTVVSQTNVGGAEDVVVVGSTAYVVAQTNVSAQTGLYAFDVSNPAAPTQSSALLVNGATRLDVEGGIAYVVGGANRGLTVVNVSNPSSPVLLSQFENGSSTFREVDAHGSRVYALDNSGALRIVDVSNPAAPVAVSTYNTGSAFGWGSAVQAYSYPGGVTRVYATVNGELHVVDVSNPASPVGLDAFNEPGEVRDQGSSPDLMAAVDGGSIWLYSNNNETPTFLAKLPYPSSNRVMIEGNLLVASDWNTGVRIYDVSNPSVPALVGQYTSPATVVEMMMRGSSLFLLTRTVSAGNSALQVLNLSNPASPTRTSEYTVPGNGIDLWVPPADDPQHANRVAIAYYNATSATGWFSLLDATNLTSLTPIATWAGRGVKPAAIELSGKRAITASMDASQLTWYLEVFDLTVPTVPVSTEWYGGIGTAIWDLVLVGPTTVAVALPDADEVALFELVTTASKDDKLEPMSRKKSRKARRLARLKRRLEARGKGYLYAAGGYASYGYPELSGSYGSTRWRYPLYEPVTMVTLTTAVQPPEAAADGATVTPAGTTSYMPGAHVTLQATAPTGWVFTEWTGSLTGTTNPADLVMDGDKEVTGHFQPTLVLGMPIVQAMQACPPTPGTEWHIATASLTALGTDWQLTGIDFTVPDGATGAISKIERALLLVRGQRVVGAMTPRSPGNDLARVSFTIPGAVIAEGETLSMQLLYVLQFVPTNENGPCSLGRLERYQASTNVSRVTAEPVPLAARPGLKLPQGQDFTSVLHEIGCVINSTRQFVSTGIQSGIDDVRTVTGDRVRVCPGTFPEAVTVSKAITLDSFEGPNRTEIRPGAGKSEPGVGIHVTSRDALIQGFFVTGAREGILIDGVPSVQVGGRADEALTRNVVSGNATGILVRGEGARDLLITGNYIGTNKAGTAALGNTGAGVFITGGSTIRVGWQGAGNLISGNGIDGVQVENAQSVGIFYNTIGLDRAEEIAIPNGWGPLGVGGVALLSGERAHISSNIISGNRGFGIFLAEGSSRNRVDDNRIGVDSDASVAFPNTLDGIYIKGERNLIGSDNRPDQPNTISGNGRHGILIEGEDATLNRIWFNYIGTNADTLDTIGNGGDGIRIKNSSYNRVGPKRRFTGPIIALNAGAGVVVEGESSVGNAIRKTVFVLNGTWGIDLGANGVTANDLTNDPDDSHDMDDGPNWQMNFPVGLIVTPMPGNADQLIISGFLDTIDPSRAEVDLYMSTVPDTSGFGEGEFFLGTLPVRADGGFTGTLARAALKYPFLSATATALDDSSTSEFSWVCLDPDEDGVVDSDGDGLCDSWETNGIDYDGDRRIDLALNAAPYGAKADHKDLFVEVDWMSKPTKNLRPVQNALDDVVAAFRTADLANGDGVNGIALHLMTDEAVPWWNDIQLDGTAAGSIHAMRVGNPYNPCDTGASDGHFGTAADRTSDRCAAILGARSLAFRYMLFGNRISGQASTLGMADLPGNDMIVASGIISNATYLWGGGFAAGANAQLATAKRRTQAGVVMHEFGHTIGLRHGGQDHDNCKPNYLSVMNYALAVHAAVPGRVLDYSSYDLPDLVETALDERVGIAGPAQRSNVFNQHQTASTVGPLVAFVGNAVNVDWDGIDSNGDGVVANDPAASADINYLPDFACPTGGKGTLTSQLDWPEIVYHTRLPDGYFVGALDRPEDAQDIGWTTEAIESTARSVDFDRDGFVNAIDNCTHIANPTQQDLDGDGIGDVCEARASDLQLDMRPSTDTPRAGSPFEYLLTVHNAGPDSTESVMVVDTLDARYTIESVVPQAGSCDVGTSTFQCDLGGLATFGVLSVTLRVMAREPGLLPNQAWVSSIELDPDTTSNRVRLAPSVASGVNNEKRQDLPERFELGTNFPNPFAVTTIVPFDVPVETDVRMQVYDMLGREVARPVDGRMAAGRHRIAIDASRWSPGVYLYRITAGSFSASRRMVLVR